jgi:hypothetical protein
MGVSADSKSQTSSHSHKSRVKVTDLESKSQTSSQTHKFCVANWHLMPPTRIWCRKRVADPRVRQQIPVGGSRSSFAVSDPRLGIRPSLAVPDPRVRQQLPVCGSRSLWEVADSRWRQQIFVRSTRSPLATSDPRWWHQMPICDTGFVSLAGDLWLWLEVGDFDSGFVTLTRDLWLWLRICDCDSRSVTLNRHSPPSERVLVQYAEPTTKLNDTRPRLGFPADKATDELGEASSEFESCLVHEGGCWW